MEYLGIIIVALIVTRLVMVIFFEGDEEEYDDELPSRIIIIERLPDDHYHVFDKITGKFICKFTNWDNLKDKLGEIDDSINWFVEYDQPELKEK